MSRQPIAGAGAAVRSPSGAAARAPAPIAVIPAPAAALSRAAGALQRAAGHALRAHEPDAARDRGGSRAAPTAPCRCMVRALGCRPRNAKTCRPGTDVGLRRAGPRPPPLNAPATRRVVAAFAGVARELAASARDAGGLRAATRHRARRAAHRAHADPRDRRRGAGAHASRGRDGGRGGDAACARGRAQAQGQVLSRAQASRPPRRRSRDRGRTLWRAQERVLREQEARMWQAHQAADRAKAAPAAAPPALDPDVDRRIDEIAERHDAEPRQRPRIRRLW